MNKTSDFERFCSFDAMYDASYRVCRNVRWKDSTINFEENRLETIYNTQEKLRNDTYEQLVFSSFSIIERGKPRDIRACHIGDRMVQNALCEQVLLPTFTPRFIYDNSATLKGKGVDFALSRFKKHLQTANRENKGEDFFGLRIDIRKYFDSISHKKLKQEIDNLFSEKEMARVTKYFVDTFAYKVTKDTAPVANKQYYIVQNGDYVPWIPRGSFSPKYDYYEYEEKSLGLGSQTSQLFALLVLNRIDHFVKEQLHIKYYGRYMDDMYMFHHDSKYLAYCIKAIGKELAKIDLVFNPDKTMITRIHPLDKKEKRQAPFKFLKWNFYITKTGHIIQLPLKKALSQQQRKLRKLQKLWLEGKLTDADIQQSYQGWRAHMDRGTTFYIKQDMDNYFRKLFKGVEII